MRITTIFFEEFIAILIILHQCVANDRLMSRAISAAELRRDWLFSTVEHLKVDIFICI